MSQTHQTRETSRHYFMMMIENQQNRQQAPTRLTIGLLYAELIRSLDRLIDALAAEQSAALPEGDAAIDAAMAQSILTQLAASVDFAQMGSASPALSSLYTRASQALACDIAGSDIAAVRQLRAAVSDIAYRWQVLQD